MSEPSPGSGLDDLTRGTVRITPNMGLTDTPKGFWWYFRIYAIYMPVFTLVNLIWPVGFLLIVLRAFFPLAERSFLSGGGPATEAGLLLTAVASLPFALSMSRGMIWMMAETTVAEAKQRGITVDKAGADGLMGRLVFGKHWLLFAMLWMLAMFPVLYSQASHYFSLGGQGVVIRTGALSSLHVHPWDELEDIHSTCRAGPDGKTHVPTYLLTFKGGDTVDVPLADKGDLDDFMRNWIKLVIAVKGRPFTFSYDGDSGCPVQWLAALSLKPGEVPMHP